MHGHQKSARFAAFKIQNDDRASSRFGDERDVCARVDTNVVQITFLQRHFFTETELFARLGSVARSIFTIFSSPLTISCIFGAAGSRTHKLSSSYHDASLYRKMRDCSTALVPIVIGKRFVGGRP